MSRIIRPAAALVVVVGGVLCRVSAAVAQVPDAAPDATLPGGPLISKVIGWAKYGALAAAMVGLLIGGIQVGIGHFGSNYSASSAGKKWLLGGIGAAIVAGLSHTIANTVYTST